MFLQKRHTVSFIFLIQNCKLSEYNSENKIECYFANLENSIRYKTVEDLFPKTLVKFPTFTLFFS